MVIFKRWPSEVICVVMGLYPAVLGAFIQLNTTTMFGLMNLK